MRVSYANVGKLGLIRDQQSYDAPPESWTEGRNVSFRHGHIERLLGDSQVFGAVGTEPYWLLHWNDGTTDYWFYASDTQVWRTDGASHLNVTRTASDYATSLFPRWNGCVLGGVPFVNPNNGTDPPQEWDGTSKFQDLTNWLASTTCAHLGAFGNYLVALDTTESGTRYPTRVRWSDATDPGSVPGSWTPLATNAAGVASLGDTTGALLTQQKLGAVNVLYKTDSIWAMSVIGGAPVMGFQKLFSNTGALSARSVADIGKHHAVLTEDDFVIHNGNTIQSVIENKIRSSLFNEIDAARFENICVVPMSLENEVWVCIPQDGSNGLLTLAYVWNWTYNTWTVRELDNIAFGAEGSIEGLSGMTFDESVGVTFDNDNGAFDDTDTVLSRDRLILAKPDEGGASPALFLAEDTNQFHGANFRAYVQRQTLPITGQARDGTPIIDTDNVLFLRAIYPRVTSEQGATIIFYIGTQLHADQIITWNGPYPFNTRNQTKIDLTLGARYFSIRVESTESFRWIMTGFDLEFEAAGRF